MGKRIQTLKLSSALILFAFTLNTYAVGMGFYMGLMTGPASNTGGQVQAQVKNSESTTLVTPRSNQWGTRIFIGNRFSTYGGIEGGLTYFSSINYNTKGVQTCNGPVARVRTFDIVGKFGFPLGYFEVFGKAGAALAYFTTSGSLNPDFTRPCGRSANENRVRPTFSIGASYELNQNWVADLSWTRILVGGQIKNVDFYGLGFSYHFVNRYCGQFLCDD